MIIPETRHRRLSTPRTHNKALETDIIEIEAQTSRQTIEMHWSLPRKGQDVEEYMLQWSGGMRRVSFTQFISPKRTRINGFVWN